MFVLYAGSHRMCTHISSMLHMAYVQYYLYVLRYAIRVRMTYIHYYINHTNINIVLIIHILYIIVLLISFYTRFIILYFTIFYYILQYFTHN